MSKSNYFWHSEKSAAELGGVEYKQQLLDSGYGLNNSFGVPPEEYADYMLSRSYPITISIETCNSGSRFYINANETVPLKLAGH